MAEEEAPGSSKSHANEDHTPLKEEASDSTRPKEITEAEAPKEGEEEARALTSHKEQEDSQRGGPTVVMIAVSQSSKGYPKASISSRHAFEWVLRNLIKPGCAKHYKLLLLHAQVVDEDGLEELDSVYASPSDFQHLRHQERAKGKGLIQQFAKRCHDAQVDCEGSIKNGDPKVVVCNEVQRKKPDLLVVGSRGLGTLQSMFVAGVSSYVAKHAECPVLVIKRDPKDIPDDPLDD